MQIKRAKRRRLQIGIRSLPLLIFVFACLAAWYEVRYRQVYKAKAILQKNNILVVASEATSQQDDSSSWLIPPEPIEAIFFSRYAKEPRNIKQVAKALSSLGTVRKVIFDGSETTVAQLEQLARVRTICKIEAMNGCSDDQVKALLTLPIEEFVARQGKVSKEQARMLVKIESLKKLGTANGEFDLPSDILETHPKLEIETTDIW